MSTDSKQPETCPVDHKSREAWLEKARAASAASAASSSSSSPPPSHPPLDPNSNANANANAETCPVDHGAREVWLQQARAASESTTPKIQAPTTSTSTSTSPTSTPTSSRWSSYLPFFSSSPTPKPNPPAAKSQLGIDREVSTIPRTTTTTPHAGGEHAPITSTTTTTTVTTTKSRPANNEQETGADSATGNWIYPSERMFFDAMKRKGHDPRAADMRTVVPIHNAVNERAWAEIKAWEAPWIQGSSCDGPRLHSFLGLSTHMSPKARINTLLGYQAPFDRHDWVVDRCGKEIEYVIDFYAGRNDGNTAADGKLSFYLDVRPKLNSWEGVKMRALRAAGLA